MKIDITKLYSRRLRNMRVTVKLLRFVPFCRCVILNGSMAEGKIELTSDIDLLIIAKSGRIYTCRAAVLFWAKLSGLKRSSNEKKSHTGRFCFNYFLTDNFLTIPHNRGGKVDKYCAENYSKSILLLGDQKVFDRFMKTNLIWMKKYIGEIPKSKLQITNKFQNPNYQISNQIQKIIEKLLSSGFGRRVEYTLKNIQIKRIKKDPAVKKYPDYIVFNDKELRFHLPKK
jgi:predicted nucleotidyltransferase